MDVPEINPDCPSCRQLLKIVQQQQEQIKRLEERIAKIEREGKRQAAPFRKKQKQTPKKPGRKKGDDYGQHHRRSVPETVDETYDVPLPECCPDCGHDELAKMDTLVQYQTEIPRTVIHRRFNIDAGVCCRCGGRVQGRHELQTSDATGAAKSQFGPNVHAAMAVLNKELGLSHGKVKRCLEMLFGLRVSRSASCRSNLRTGDRLQHADNQIRQAVRGSPQVVGDETGWRIGGQNAWLHAFVGLNATCYQIDRTRGVGPAERVLGKAWSGVFGHDGWAVYDQFESAIHQQCLAHLCRRCDSLIESAVGGALAFPRAVKDLLNAGLTIRNRYRLEEITSHGLKVLAGRFTMKLWELVRSPKQHAGNERLAKFLERHLEHVFTFLRYPGADATNWRGEQAIRPAVVNRKVWGGNRTERGALAQSRIMSVIQTCKQRSADPFSFIHAQLTSQSALPLPLPVCSR